MKRDSKLRFGVIRDAGPWQAWQAACVRSVLDSRLCELRLVVTVPPRAAPNHCLAFRAFGKLALGRSRALRATGLTVDLREVPQLDCEMENNRSETEQFSDSAIRKVSSHDLDFILSFASDSLSKPTLQSARHGVWAFEFGDPAKYPPGPVAFQEICHRDPICRACLRNLSGEPGGKTVLYEGFFPAFPWSWKHSVDAVLFGCADWPLRACREIFDGCGISYVRSATAQPRTRPPAEVVPSMLETLRGAARISAAFLRRQLSDLVMREQWNVGFVRAPIESFLDPRQKQVIEWLPCGPRTRFLADSFGLRTDGKVTILAEDFDHVSRKGHIVALSSSDDGRTFSAPARISGDGFDDPSHKSYPYLLQHDGAIFCVPESWEKSEVALYRAIRFPDKWERVCALLKDVEAVDATPFEFAGSWWMFYTVVQQGTGLKLYLSTARELYGPWVPHPANPIKTDVRGSRPGGTPFVHEGKLYRPAQDCSRGYGGAISLFKVTTIDARRYEEEFVCRLTHDERSPFARGFHTLSAAGDFCVVDGKRMIALPQGIPGAIVEKVRWRFRRLRSTERYGYERRQQAVLSGYRLSRPNPAAAESREL